MSQSRNIDNKHLARLVYYSPIILLVLLAIVFIILAISTSNSTFRYISIGISSFFLTVSIFRYISKLKDRINANKSISMYKEVYVKYILGLRDGSIIDNVRLTSLYEILVDKANSFYVTAMKEHAIYGIFSRYNGLGIEDLVEYPEFTPPLSQVFPDIHDKTIILKKPDLTKYMR